jgi:hypothetical protein
VTITDTGVDDTRTGEFEAAPVETVEEAFVVEPLVMEREADASPSLALPAIIALLSLAGIGTLLLFRKR